ncbi:hypothetical protein HDU84_000462, partial [Entophlyctis sp. JEL0112]
MPPAWSSTPDASTLTSSPPRLIAVPLRVLAILLLICCLAVSPAAAALHATAASSASFPTTPAPSPQLQTTPFEITPRDAIPPAPPVQRPQHQHQPAAAPRYPSAMSDADRERRIDEFCRENNINREDLTQAQHDALVDRLKFLEQHRGHEAQHAEMAVILIASLVVFQIILTIWK